MKKTYIHPSSNVVAISMEQAILASSGLNHNDIEIGISDEDAYGSQALSERKQSMWDTKGMWE